jgi:tetratricopeptide (TPR) repeat protein
VVLLNLGKIAERQGDYLRAEALLQEGLVLARQRGDHEQTGHLLMNLEAVSTHRGDYVQAEKYGWEGLALARQQGDPEQISGMLLGLDSLAIFEKIGHRLASDVKQWLKALPRESKE